MAKLFETYSISPKYTKPFRVKFSIYLAGAFEGFGDISYYSITISNNQEEREVKRYNFSKSNLAKVQEQIIEYISFIECDKFDTISLKEFDYIKSDDFSEITSLLDHKPIQFSGDFSMCKIGRASLQWNETNIQIPNEKSRIGISYFSCQVNIFKIILFVFKLNLISNLLYEHDYLSSGPECWKKTNLNYYTNLDWFNEAFQSRCPYYKIM